MRLVLALLLTLGATASSVSATALDWTALGDEAVVARGVPCYGFTPLKVPSTLWTTVHGNDERVPVDAAKETTRTMADLVARLATR